MTIRDAALSVARGAYRGLECLRYAIFGGRNTAPSVSYAQATRGSGGRLPIVLWFRGDLPHAPAREHVASWLDLQTLGEAVAIAVDGNGVELWRYSPEAGSETLTNPFWFAAPNTLAEIPPSHLESCFLVAAAEDVDAVILVNGTHSADADHRPIIGEECEHPLRATALYRADAYGWDPATDRVAARRTDRVIKIIDLSLGPLKSNSESSSNQSRGGPYLSSKNIGARLTIPVRDASKVPRHKHRNTRPSVLVTLPFLARGGAEQTLLATLGHLADRFDFTIATLAPHREELGDRRGDFRTVTERILPLGDLVHPDVMVGVLQSILDATGAEILYNANGTTLFYEFAARLRQSHPKLRIIDHLYDHEVGYIERYDEGLKTAVDACVAENHLIARELVEGRGWPKERVPVIWPCGRPEADLPQPADRELIRRSLREQLGLGADDVVVLTAARMHPQKRPLDLVLLAERVRDLNATHFVVVGGGELEGEMDRAIAARPGLNLRRLPFRTDIPELIVASDVGCLVSDFEGLPVFMLECLQLGRPFLGTRVGDLGSVLDDTGAGLVIDRPGDLDELEAAVRRLSDRSFRSKLAERALRAAPKFSVDRCAAAYAAAFTGRS